ncbi:MAG: hypothetical protein A2161_07545 [Candidatus Schekmanbacteria bacterium RBG_13_48_7]|uniref:Uncharacterized protein n=1 Tax=Candidatus Schekmanbacteria bacterium RBG_13_48_7 TaxID=1817878 RepID=A0A1F7RHV7_9BACT|nr:MAG: hypothetical protein A2161_07545 [Candidatus Schekmanbacteria bacterium RBG_13_48_7]
MKDGIVRKTIKYVALARYMIDLKITRLIKSVGNSQTFHLEGSCNRCGKCCENPAIILSAPFFYLKTNRWLTLKWHKIVNGFEFVGENRKEKCFIFRCTHWNPETKLCDSYETRPGLCRDYPRNQIDSTDPVFMDSCGYYAVRKNAESMGKAIDKLLLSEEKTDKLKQKLHIK